jgi:hypothetical protein
VLSQPDAPAGGQTQACALATADGNTFLLVRGGGAENDCQVLLTDLSSSTVQTWQLAAGQIPPGTASNLDCDLIAISGNRVTV